MERKHSKQMDSECAENVHTFFFLAHFVYYNCLKYNDARLFHLNSDFYQKVRLQVEHTFYKYCMLH